MEFNRTIAQYMEHCRSRQLRQKTMSSYEQTLTLFAIWMRQMYDITQVEVTSNVCAGEKEEFRLAGPDQSGE